ncbi:PDT-domain-containing protein [Wolfiporia cocos MD-104 SS10]|uniref:PDT-domain-containing protein n=1 Tax=Wolfiporia cocos (strain MD-104) TaxID=742152 RepID=A0A2H3IVL7_WOLCO|nr:PDT-domain-containing protein [Wolfiporia cocos MD-104 SS10]
MICDLAEPSLPKLAFLGPLGSHSYQCARSGFKDGVEYVEKPTIADVFNAISSEIPFGLLPQENSVYGTVTETYNLLRMPEVGKDKFIRGELMLKIRHSLVVRRGVKLEDVTRVLSHEQALGQCARFLSKTLPSATRVRTPSTSAAAQMLLSDDEESGRSAAICSALCVTTFDGLEILQEDVQDSLTNQTRFYVLANSLHTPLPSAFQIPPPQHALVRIALKPKSADTDADLPPRNRLVHLVTSTLLTTFGLPTTRIDRRPSLSDEPFEDVYIIELEDCIGAASYESPQSYAVLDTKIWKRMAAGVERVEATGGEACVLGVW